MTTTYCDVCKNAIDENYADRELAVTLYDPQSRLRLRAEVRIKVAPSLTQHLCEGCAERLLKQGKLWR